MELSDKTARQIWEEVKANPTRARFGFGTKAVLVNIDLQKAYTATGEFATAYETDPRQMEYVNQLADFREQGWPVVWTYVAYMESGEDAGVWGTRTNTPDSLQNIKVGSRRADSTTAGDRADRRHRQQADGLAFFETPAVAVGLAPVDTVVVTGGSTSGCVRATVVDTLSRGYRTIVPEQCVADKHESPHFANLSDMALKYADVVTSPEVMTPRSRAERAPAEPQDKRKETLDYYDLAVRRAARRSRWPAARRRLLGRAEHRVLRTGPAEESEPHALAAADPDVPATRIRDYGNRVGHVRQMKRWTGTACAARLAHVALCTTTRRSSRCARSAAGSSSPRHLQHALHLRHERGPGARAIQTRSTPSTRTPAEARG